jgi:diphthamide synthase (EF-2-diphthine--ammonia ligase)
MFRECKLGKDEDWAIWINNLEDLRLKFKAMGSSMTDDPFMIQVLNSLTAEYELQMLNLKFERLSSKKNDESGEEKMLFVT